MRRFFQGGAIRVRGAPATMSRRLAIVLAALCSTALWAGLLLLFSRVAGYSVSGWFMACFLSVIFAAQMLVLSMMAASSARGGDCLSGEACDLTPRAKMESALDETVTQIDGESGIQRNPRPPQQLYAGC